jgi:hypothetical protein
MKTNDLGPEPTATAGLYARGETVPGGSPPRSYPDRRGLPQSPTCHDPARWLNPDTGLCEHTEHDLDTDIEPAGITPEPCDECDGTRWPREDHDPHCSLASDDDGWDVRRGWGDKPSDLTPGIDYGNRIAAALAEKDLPAWAESLADRGECATMPSSLPFGRVRWCVTHGVAYTIDHAMTQPGQNLD